MTAYNIAPLQAAASALAAVCDGARDLDGRGYSGVDTHFGHMLAELPGDLWDDDTTLAAWHMLRKYKGQLAGAGILWDAIERPPGADALEDEYREARARAKDRARQWRRNEQFKRGSWVACDGAGELVTLHFAHYDEGLVRASRLVPGRYWNCSSGSSEYPFTSLVAVVELADKHGIPVPREVRALVRAALQENAEQARALKAAVAAAATAPEMYLENGQIVIRTQYKQALSAELHYLNGRKSTWDPDAKVDRLPPSVPLHMAAEIGARHGLRMCPEIQQVASAHAVNRIESSAETAAPVEVPGLAEGEALLEQQWPVVRFAVRNKGVLVGDDMGLGKTLSSVASVAVAGKLPVIIACRPSLTINWERELRRFFPRWRVHIATGQTPSPVPSGTDAVIIGTAALGFSDKAATAARRELSPQAPAVFPWVTVLAGIRPQAMILDEGHDAKEQGAHRSQALLQLAEHVHAAAGMVLDLTGTAIVNKVGEIIQQLKIIGRWHEFGCTEPQFRRQYRDLQGWLKLHDRLRAWGIMVRRTDKILPLPPLREHILPLTTEDLDPVLFGKYKRAEKDVVEYLASEAERIALELGTNPRDARVKAEMAANAAIYLVQINALRQLLGRAKVRICQRWITTQIMLGQKVMIAGHHQAVVDAMASRFGGLTIRGGQSTASKEEHKEIFQHHPIELAPAITVSIGAGGVGHTLTAARIGLQVESPWTPGEYKQMMKRTHRIGQTHPVDYYRAIVHDTLDDHMDGVVHTKQATLSAVLDGEAPAGDLEEEMTEETAAARVAWDLAQQGLALRDLVSA